MDIIMDDMIREIGEGDREINGIGRVGACACVVEIRRSGGEISGEISDFSIPIQ